MALLNSIVNSKAISEISIQDRGFNYGDGLFETMIMVNHQPVFWDEHYQRLLNGCTVLGIECPSAKHLKNEIEQLCSLNPTVAMATIKLILTRGDSERGYQCAEGAKPNIIISLLSYPDYSMDYWREGVKVKFCQTRLSYQKRLIGVKHLNRLEQVLARQEWVDEYQEGLMADTSGNIIEGVMSNIFIIKDDVVHTPLINQAGVDGIIRNIVLKLCEAHGIMVVEGEISQEQVLDADEVFLTNSLIGLWPVKQAGNKVYKTGLKTKNIMKLLIDEYSVDYAALYI